MATKITFKRESKQMTYGDLKVGDIFCFENRSRALIRMESGYCLLNTGRTWCDISDEAAVVVVYDAEIILTERK